MGGVPPFWLHDWHSTPRWLSSHWRHRHGQSFLWPARARTKIPARNLRHDHTQGASTQCAELPAEWLGGAPSLDATRFTVCSVRPGITGRSPATDFSDAWRCASLCVPNSPCATPDWGSQNELQPPTPTTPHATAGPIKSEKLPTHREIMQRPRPQHGPALQAG